MGKLHLLVLLFVALVFVDFGLFQPQATPGNLHFGRVGLFARWGSQGQGMLVTCIAVDHQQRVWVGTEDTGIWMYGPAANGEPTWTRFDSNNGLGDDSCYSLLCDSEGRVWAGTLNHGVSVFIGTSWRNYDQTSGPLGSRVFAIAANPADHDVWIATENGLSRYCMAKNTWRYYTTLDGLSSNQASSLSFDQDGNISVGTQCNGVDLGSAMDDFSTWRNITGPLEPTAAASGTGLPSPLINVVVERLSGSIFVGTDEGLARSDDGGKTWSYIRGANWTDKANQLYSAPQTVGVSNASPLLTEDYVTTVFDDANGNVWVGHRRTGLECLNPKTFKSLLVGTDSDGLKELSSVFVKSVLQVGSRLLVGTYGDGLLQLQLAASDALPQEKYKSTSTQFPSVSSSSSFRSIAQIEQKFTYTNFGGGRQAVYVGDDWNTEGDWIGRYGRQFAVLCAAGSPFDHDGGTDNRYLLNAYIGEHHAARDSLRYWIDCLSTDDPRTLYDPLPGCRRQASWVDDGQAYSASYAGPDIWIAVQAPVGLHRLSFYFRNYDGAGGDNRYRDYTVEVRNPTDDETTVSTDPPLAIARVCDFRGGVYKSFILSGPFSYRIRISRNYSLNAIVSGVFLDRIQGPAYMTDASALPWMGGLHVDPPPMLDKPPVDPHLLDILLEGRTPQLQPDLTQTDQNDVDLARRLWSGLNEQCNSDQLLLNSAPLKILMYRALLKRPFANLLQDNWRWNLHLWSLSDRTTFSDTMLLAHQRLLKYNLEMVGQSY